MTTDKTVLKNLRLIIGAVLAMIFLPYMGGYIYTGGKFPEDYFAFPPLVPGEKAPFSPLVFGICLALMLVVTVLYIFPQLFGFKKPPISLTTDNNNTPKAKVPFPTWFWVGLVMWGATLVVLWGHFTGPKFILYWAALPLYWGFTLVLDGIVYKRTGGTSIISTKPREIIGIGIASISGWLIFEYLNFFVEDNWAYPMGVELPVAEFTLYAVLGSSGLMPMALDWYSLLNTFKKFRYKYSFGPKITLPRWLKIGLLVVSLVVMFLIPFYPQAMFGALWLTPLILLGLVLNFMKVWSPFEPIKNGNWSPLAISGLAYGIQGFLCEFWNYFSGIHNPDGTVFSHNPDYWI